MALLAYSRAVRGVGAREAAKLALRALGGDRLFNEGPASPGLMAAGLALGLAGRTLEADALSDLTVAGRRPQHCGDSIMFEWRSTAAIAHHRLARCSSLARRWTCTWATRTASSRSTPAAS